MDALTELERYVSSLNGEQKAELDQMLAPELAAPWLPDPRNEPQVEAYYSLADLLLRKPITGVCGCCARAACGQIAVPPRIPRKSRRRMSAPSLPTKHLISSNAGL